MPAEGFSFVNLAILVVVALIVVPGYRWLRTTVSANRRQRWAREDADYRAAVEGQDTGPTPPDGD
jgi:Tfp pilus assembly protein PilX